MNIVLLEIFFFKIRENGSLPRPLMMEATTAPPANRLYQCRHNFDL